MSDSPEQPPAAGQAAADPATCYRHPDREAHIRCTRCERRICPDCMIPAAVGFQCPECVRDGNKDVRRARTVFGGSVSGEPGVVSKTLMALIVLAFIAQQVVDGFTERFYDIGLAVDPATFETVGVADGEVYRLLTSAFLHGGLLHVLLNLYAIYMFGPHIEAALGRWRFTVLYFVSALGGSALSYAFAAPNQPSLGASGAVFGLLGAFLVISRKLRRDTTAVMVLLAINFAYGFLVPRVDWRAHLGGLVAGGLVALAMAYAPRDRRTLVQVAGTVAVVLVAVAVVVWRTVELRGPV